MFIMTIVLFTKELFDLKIKNILRIVVRTMKLRIVKEQKYFPNKGIKDIFYIEIYSKFLFWEYYTRPYDFWHYKFDQINMFLKQNTAEYAIDILLKMNTNKRYVIKEVSDED